MLHSNRKAEIQILSSGSVATRDGVNETLRRIFAGNLPSSDNDVYVPSQGAGNALVEYIMESILALC
jgi:hypothetical protein